MTNSARVEERQNFDDGKLRSCSIIGRPFSRTSVAYKKNKKTGFHSQSLPTSDKDASTRHKATHTHTHNHSTKKQTKKQRNKCSWWTDGRTRQQTKQQTCFDLSVLLSAFCGKTKYPPGKLRGWSKEPRTVTVAFTVAFTVALSVGDGQRTERKTPSIDQSIDGLPACLPACLPVVDRPTAQPTKQLSC